MAGMAIECVCPVCKGPLSDTKSCPHCQTTYEEQNGILFFVLKDLRERAQKEVLNDKENAFKNYFKRWPNFYQWCIRIVAPVLFTGLTAKQFASRFKGEEKILNVGSGPTIIHPRSVNVDMLPFPSVHAVCEAEALPFASNSFDVTLSEEVMEHVRDPKEMAAEMKRVTKQDGLIYVSLPFMFPYHPSPKDYWRLSTEGLQALFADCEEIECGIHSGPVSGMLVVMAAGLATIFSLGYRPLQQILNYPFMIVLSPFKLLDLYYARTSAANITASGVYIVVKKK